jgi:hypothetical protein
LNTTVNYFIVQALYPVKLFLRNLRQIWRKIGKVLANTVQSNPKEGWAQKVVLLIGKQKVVPSY